MKGSRRNKFWSLGNLRLSNFSALLSLLPLLIGGFLVVVTEGKAEGSHRPRYTEECCVVAQTFPPGYEYEGPFPDRFSDRTSEVYEVFVPTYSPDLLDFVRNNIDGRARFDRRGQRAVITLGTYDLNGARRRVRQLTRQGITAEMVARNRGSNNSDFSWENSRYVVYLSVGRRTYIEDTLYRVQGVVPDASVWQYQGRNVILLGQFADRSEALAFRNELRRQGIWALFARNPITPVVPRISSNETNLVSLENPRENRFAALENPVVVDNNNVPENSYRVVIPTRREELAAIEGQVRQMAIDLGMQDDVLIEIDRERSQLIVGPFSESQTAQDWRSYLAEYGMINARVINSR
ncbi:hypothetical protein ACE1B6_03045 [Aerosakkonemataceae cyanobacterium BLCC-F154]|uniref:SPOR domain-containing protein n=1 Tax=Floridaenema fluviatile BLCC-F154 TaxID=3153640 RepID=A0ABV4Y8I2_9CYAN